MYENKKGAEGADETVFDRSTFRQKKFCNFVIISNNNQIVY